MEDSTYSPPSHATLVFNSTAACRQQPEKAQSGAANIIFQSTDGGQTWQDISAGLPADLLAEDFFAGDGELYLGAKNGMYHRSTASTVPVWEKEISFNDRSTTVSPGRDSSLSAPGSNKSLDDRSTTVSPGRAGPFAYNGSGHFFQKRYGMGIWLPMFTNFQDQSVRTIFETFDGTFFIGCDNGIFKSADHGKTWKHVFEDGWVMKMVESNGVLLCTNEHGILRSTDGGEHWDSVLSEGGVGIAVEIIEGGFAAITYNTESETRRVRISADGGKTWQAIDAGLPAQASIASIKQVGEYFFCGHPDGIFRSSDKGKTWELLLPSIGKKVFNLSVSGNVIYAVPRAGGC